MTVRVISFCEGALSLVFERRDKRWKTVQQHEFVPVLEERS